MDGFKFTGTLVRAIAVFAGGLILYGPPRVVRAAGGGTASFAPATTFRVGLSPLSVAVGDFNGDGKLDLAVANETSGSVSILLGTGNGNFGAATDFGVGTGPASVAVG